MCLSEFADEVVTNRTFEAEELAVRDHRRPDMPAAPAYGEAADPFIETEVFHRITSSKTKHAMRPCRSEIAVHELSKGSGVRRGAETSQIIASDPGRAR